MSTPNQTVAPKALTCGFHSGTYTNTAFVCATVHTGHYTSCFFVNCYVQGGTFVNCAFRHCKIESEVILINYHQMKFCSSCCTLKPTSCFSKNRRAADRLQAKCKDCFSVYYHQNKEHMIKQQGEYHQTIRGDPIFQARAEARHSLKKALDTGAMVQKECGCGWNFLQGWLRFTAYFYAPNTPYDSLVMDHFRPIASFDLQGEGRRWVNHWSNLRRITKHENHKKQASPPSEHEIAVHMKLAERFEKYFEARAERESAC